MSQAMINSVMLAVFGSALTFIATWFWRSRQGVLDKAKAISEEHQRTLVRLAELEQKLALVNQAVIPISTAFQAILIKELTHAHTPEMDALLVKIGPPNTLTEEEEARLTVMLRERYSQDDPSVPDAERDAAFILPAVVKRARTEADLVSVAEAMKVQLVTVATLIGVPNTTTEETYNNTTEQSLKNIEANTAATAESLATLNTRATERLGTVAARKGIDAERGN